MAVSPFVFSGRNNREVITLHAASFIVTQTLPASKKLQISCRKTESLGAVYSRLNSSMFPWIRHSLPTPSSFWSWCCCFWTYSHSHMFLVVAPVVWNVHWLLSRKFPLNSLVKAALSCFTAFNTQDVKQGKYQRETIVWKWILYLQIISLALGTAAELWHVSQQLFLTNDIMGC